MRYTPQGDVWTVQTLHDPSHALVCPARSISVALGEGHEGVSFDEAA